jgi:hypothetical protein
LIENLYEEWRVENEDEKHELCIVRQRSFPVLARHIIWGLIWATIGSVNVDIMALGIKASWQIQWVYAGIGEEEVALVASIEERVMCGLGMVPSR